MGYYLSRKYQQGGTAQAQQASAAAKVMLLIQRALQGDAQSEQTVSAIAHDMSAGGQQGALIAQQLNEEAQNGDQNAVVALTVLDYVGQGASVQEAVQQVQAQAQQGGATQMAKEGGVAGAVRMKCGGKGKKVKKASMGMKEDIIKTYRSRNKPQNVINLPEYPMEILVDDNYPYMSPSNFKVNPILTKNVQSPILLPTLIELEDRYIDIPVKEDKIFASNKVKTGKKGCKTCKQLHRVGGKLVNVDCNGNIVK